MLSEEEITIAVAIQNKSYKLLKWLEQAMTRDFISPRSAHINMSAPEVTGIWIRSHLHNIPEEARPSIADQVEFDRFCNFFSSYLLTSFDIVERPGMRLYSEDAHCFCPMCSYLVRVPHLQTKKLGGRDRKQAAKLKRDALQQLCLETDTAVPADKFEFLIHSPEYREATSTVAYGHQLVLRTVGEVKGPGALVLWREIAWTDQGSPKKKFALTAELILRARERVVAYLRQ